MAPRYQRPSQTWRWHRSTVTSSDQLAATPSSPAASTTQPNGVSLVLVAFFRHTLPDLPFTGYVLVHVELDYRREVRIEHRYLIGECSVADLGRSRVELDNRLLLPDGDVAVEGRAVLVAWDEQSRRSRELTQHERGALLSRERDRLRQ